MRRLAALWAVLALVAVGCGDDDGGGTAPTTTEVPTEETTDGGGEEALTGEPVRLMAIADTRGLGEGFANLELGARAAAEAINREGDLDGRPVEVELCDAGGNANGAAACARRAVEEGFVAVVGSTTTQGAAYLPVLEEAGIPSVANLGVGSADFQSPVAYPITTGTAGYAVAMGSLAASIGASAVGVVYVDVEGGALAGGAVGLGLTPNGGTTATQTPVAPNTPDLATAYAAASSGVDAVAIALTTADATRFVVAARQAGGDVPLIAPQAALDPVSLEELGDAAEGVYLTSFFLPVRDDQPAMAEVLADFEALGEDFTWDDVAVNAWAGVRLVALAAEQADDLTGPAVRAALDALGEIDLGILPPFSFQSPVSGIPTFERTFNNQVIFNQVRDGEVVPVTGEFVNPFEPLA